MLHETDSLNIINNMSNGAALRFCKAFFKATGKKVEDVSKDEIIKFKNDNWFKLAKVGLKTLEEFDAAELLCR